MESCSGGEDNLVFLLERKNANFQVEQRPRRHRSCPPPTEQLDRVRRVSVSRVVFGVEEEEEEEEEEACYTQLVVGKGVTKSTYIPNR